MKSPKQVWLVTIGEPVPGDGKSVRLYRTGMLAHYLADCGHEVEWWNSDFDHHRKVFRCGADVCIRLRDNLRLHLLHGCGYQKHISLARLRDHRKIADLFYEKAVSMAPPDVIVAGYPTIELADACRRYCLLRHVPYALDIRDLWPDVIIDSLPTFLKAAGRFGLYHYDAIARRALKAADALIGVTQPMLEWGLNKASRKQHSLDAVIPFAYPSLHFDGTDDEISILKENGVDPCKHFIVCFFGTFGRQFDFYTVIEAARRLYSRNPNVRFMLCGDGDQLEKYRIIAADVKSIAFPGWISAKQIQSIMRAAHLGLAPYISNANFRGNLPNKPVEYLSAGLPILTCLEGVLSDLVRCESVGVIYKANDAQSLVEAIDWIVANPEAHREMKCRSFALYHHRFRSEIVMEQYHRFVLRLSSQNGGAVV